MRYGKWKLHLPHDAETVTRAGSAGFRGDYGQKQIDWSLYELDDDKKPMGDYGASADL